MHPLLYENKTQDTRLKIQDNCDRLPVTRSPFPSRFFLSFKFSKH